MLILGFISSFVTADSPDDANAKVLDFEQHKTSAHMVELEERMYRLAEMIRDVEPDHSARLMLGLQKAREHLIVEKMREVRELLGGEKLDWTVDRQSDIIIKLEELRDLLLSADLDLILKLDQLRRLTRAIEQLKEIIKEEQRERDAAKNLESAVNNADRSRRFLQLAGDQKKNQAATESVRAGVRRLVKANSSVPGQLASASGSMSAAGSSLTGQDAGSAVNQQDRAIEELQKAKEALEDQRQQLLEELRHKIRALVMETLQDMLEEQSDIRESMETFVRRIDSGDSTARRAVVRLEPRERDLGDKARKTAKIIEETEYSLALPIAMYSLESQMNHVADRLGRGNSDPDVIEAARRIERELTELLELMKDRSSSGGTGAGQGGCKSCKGDRRLLAELKTIRFLQVKVNSDTTKVDVDRDPAGDELSRKLKSAIAELATRQSDIGGATGKLHDQACAACAQAR
jgi:hypothetical protein